MKIYGTCSGFKARKNAKEWAITIVIDDANVVDSWKTNPWSLVDEPFEIEHMEEVNK